MAAGQTNSQKRPNLTHCSQDSDSEKVTQRILTRKQQEQKRIIKKSWKRIELIRR
jgi:hypothetical protein